MKILGIETSCDETAAAVVEDGVRILSNQVASQVEIHARYGGIVPEVASRQHILAIIPILKQAMTEANVTWLALDGVAVTMGPGLAGSLLVGVNMAKAIALAHRLPITGVNHLEGHIYANWLTEGSRPTFPLICLIVSGGHSDLVLMKGHGEYVLLGRTRDDAAGEAFDKAARILELGYPGGPAIDRAARNGTASIPLPHAWLKGTDDFSFSGLKTALLYDLRGRDEAEVEAHRADIAASYQAAIVDQLVEKTLACAAGEGLRSVAIAGGVAANSGLRRALSERCEAEGLRLSLPPLGLCTDNAGMIGILAERKLLHGVPPTPLDADIRPSWRLG
jgi:N6-L-threonylcarbamoyladenine synthase